MSTIMQTSSTSLEGRSSTPENKVIAIDPATGASNANTAAAIYTRGTIELFVLYRGTYSKYKNAAIDNTIEVMRNFVKQNMENCSYLIIDASGLGVMFSRELREFNPVSFYGSSPVVKGSVKSKREYCYYKLYQEVTHGTINIKGDRSQEVINNIHVLSNSGKLPNKKKHRSKDMQVVMDLTDAASMALLYNI